MNTPISQLRDRVSNSPSGALFSRDRAHRYLLWRNWSGIENLILFVGLNPSVADEHSNDPTIRRLMGFAKREQASGLLVANLFSFCATDPRDLKSHSAPIGPAFKKWLTAAQKLSAKTIVCWGNHGAHLSRSAHMSPEFSESYCFGLTKTGEPKHPLYLRSDAGLQPLV